MIGYVRLLVLVACSVTLAVLAGDDEFVLPERTEPRKGVLFDQIGPFKLGTKTSSRKSEWVDIWFDGKRCQVGAIKNDNEEISSILLTWSPQMCRGRDVLSVAKRWVWMLESKYQVDMTPCVFSGDVEKGFNADMAFSDENTCSPKRKTSISVSFRSFPATDKADVFSDGQVSLIIGNGGLAFKPLQYLDKEGLELIMGPAKSWGCEKKIQKRLDGIAINTQNDNGPTR